MTYADFCRNVTATEFDLWVALAQVRNDECPHCGTDARDFMEYEARQVKCPVCKNKYSKTDRIDAVHGVALDKNMVEKKTVSGEFS